MKSMAESILAAVESQLKQLPGSPKVERNKAYANRLADLPFISMRLGEDDVPDDDLSADATYDFIFHHIELNLDLVVGKVKDKSLSESLYNLADEIAWRFEEQLGVLRQEAEGLVQIAEGGMAEVEYGKVLKTTTAMATKTFTVQYQKPRRRRQL